VAQTQKIFSKWAYLALLYFSLVGTKGLGTCHNLHKYKLQKLLWCKNLTKRFSKWAYLATPHVVASIMTTRKQETKINGQWSTWPAHALHLVAYKSDPIAFLNE